MRVFMCVGARVYVCVWVRLYINIYIYKYIERVPYCVANLFFRCFPALLVVLLIAAGEEEGEEELLAVITQMCRICLESFNTCSGTWEVC